MAGERNPPLFVLHFVQYFPQQKVLFLLQSEKPVCPFVDHVEDKNRDAQADDPGKHGKEKEMLVHGVVLKRCIQKIDLTNPLVSHSCDEPLT